MLSCFLLHVFGEQHGKKVTAKTVLIKKTRRMDRFGAMKSYVNRIPLKKALNPRRKNKLMKIGKYYFPKNLVCKTKAEAFEEIVSHHKLTTQDNWQLN